MCSHAGHSNIKQPIARLMVDHRDFDEVQWMNVMQKAHHLAQQREEQEAILDIQQEAEFKHLIYPQSLIELKKKLQSLGANQTLKIKTASLMIKNDLSAAARLLQCKVEDILTEQYLYLTRT